MPHHLARAVSRRWRPHGNVRVPNGSLAQPSADAKEATQHDDQGATTTAGAPARGEDGQTSPLHPGSARNLAGVTRMRACGTSPFRRSAAHTPALQSPRHHLRIQNHKGPQAIACVEPGHPAVPLPTPQVQRYARSGCPFRPGSQPSPRRNRCRRPTRRPPGPTLATATCRAESNRPHAERRARRAADLAVMRGRRNRVAVRARHGRPCRVTGLAPERRLGVRSYSGSRY